MILKDRLQELQNKPYRARLRALWIVVGAAAVFLLIIWFITIKFRQPASAGTDSPDEFQQIFDNFKNLKDKFR